MVAVTDALCTEVQGGLHSLWPLAIPGVTGEGHAQLLGELEHRRELGQGRHPLRTRKVDGHHALTESAGRLPDRLQILRHVQAIVPDAHGAEDHPDVDGGMLAHAPMHAPEDRLHRVPLGKLLS